jgi:hypothetical protein
MAERNKKVRRAQPAPMASRRLVIMDMTRLMNAGLLWTAAGSLAGVLA